MSYSLKQQGLLSYDERSLVFVRLLEARSGERLVLVLTPSDNPGASPINAAEALISELTSAFGQARVFVGFPEFDRGEWTELLPRGSEVEYRRQKSERLAAIVGSFAALPPAEACRCEDLAPGDVLLALVPEPEPQRRAADDLRVVAVAELPWPHHPFRCAHAERFSDLEQLYPPGARETGAVGAHWHTTLTPTDYAGCGYHAADWNTAAHAAVQIAQAGIPTSLAALRAAIETLGVPDETAAAALSLFTDPIGWSPGTPQVTNGQHRVCALRASGAPLAVIDTSGNTAGNAADPRSSTERAADDISAYWATHPQTAQPSHPSHPGA
jgi:hypothetical protein